MITRAALAWWLPASFALGACSTSSGVAAAPSAASDAGDSVDAASDAAGEADAADPTPAEAEAGLGYCASTGPHFFCDDFDEDPLTHDWDALTVQHGALTLDAARATSAPYALLATSPALAVDAVTTASLAKQVVDTPPQVHVAFDFAADALDPGGALATVFVLDLLAVDGSLAEVLSLEVHGAGGVLVDGDGGAFLAQHPFSWPQLATGTWSRVELDVVFASADVVDGGPGGGTVSIGVDGQPALAPVAMAPTAQPSIPELQLGLVSLAGPSAAVAVRFDDFTFATLPP
jgi:hypothetical protein